MLVRWCQVQSQVKPLLILQDDLMYLAAVHKRAGDYSCWMLSVFSWNCIVTCLCTVSALLGEIVFVFCFFFTMSVDNGQMETTIRNKSCVLSLAVSHSNPFPQRLCGSIHHSVQWEHLLKPTSWLGWDETSTPAEASDLKSDPFRSPIQSVKFFCSGQ